METYRLNQIYYVSEYSEWELSMESKDKEDLDQKVENEVLDLNKKRCEHGQE